MVNDEYLASRVMTASPAQLHLMVVDGALRHSNAALVAMKKSNREQAWSSLSEARAHVAELLSGVAESDAEPIVNTRELFRFTFRELMFADHEQSAPRIESAIQILQAHRETWVMLLEAVAKDPSMQEQTEPSTGLNIGA